MANAMDHRAFAAPQPCGRADWDDLRFGDLATIASKVRLCLAIRLEDWHERGGRHLNLTNIRQWPPVRLPKEERTE